MAWPANVADGDIITAGYINSVKASVGSWGGDVAANNVNLMGCGTITVGIAAGTPDAGRKFSVVQASQSWSAQGAMSIGTGLAVTDACLMFGVSDAGGGDNYAWIQSSKPGTAARALYFNPGGGGCAFSIGNGANLPNSNWQVTLNEAGNQATFWFRYSTGALKAVSFTVA